MSDTVEEPIMAEFVQVFKSFQVAYALNNQQMLTIASEAAEMMKRAILIENRSSGNLPADAVKM